MKGISNKIKIIIVVVVFLLFTVGMMMFGYNIMAERNQTIATTIAEQKIELDTLDREQKSFEQGKKDLARLSSSMYPPDELFSSDTKVVKEIQQLESAAQLYSLNLTISVTGSSKTAVPVPGTTAGLYAVPYTITVKGPFNNVMKFMQTIERLPFITHAKNVSVEVDSENNANTVISSEFYLKKPKP